MSTSSSGTMKKSYKWPHDNWNEEERPRDHQQQRSNTNTEEPRKFSKHDSFRRGEDYFEDENKSVGCQRNSYQMERRPQHTIQTSQVIAPRFQAFKRVSCTTEEHPLKQNSTEEHQILNDAIKGTKDTTNTESFSTRRNSNEINVDEGNPSKNNEVKHMHCSNENSSPVLQKYSTPFCESNQSTQYFSKQYDDQSNTNCHDLSKNVCTYKDSLSDNTCNDSQRTAFLNCPPPHERYDFSMLKLIDLLYYKANLMQDQALFDFSTAVKCKVLEAINNLPYPVREELAVLCEITDGDQSEKNQQIITTRTCHIVRNIIEKFPHVLNTLETPPPSQILVYQTMPNFQGMANICYSNNKPPFSKIVLNSEGLLTPATDCNLMSDYNKITQNDKCVISKTTTDSFDNTNFNDYKNSCETHNFNTNVVENNSAVNSSLIAEENKNIVEESSKHSSSPPVNSEHKPVHTFSFNEDDHGFTSFKLDKLLNFNIHAMCGEVVFKYAFSMKERILEKINYFKDPYKNKLKLLCELTDGTQREHNQKLINERMCDLIYDFKDEIGQKHWQTLLNEESKDVDIRSHDEHEMLHRHRQNIDGQSRKTQQRRPHDEDEVVHEHRQNFSDGQSWNAHPKQSHDEVVHMHRQNFTDEQSKIVQSRRLHSDDGMVHKHRQNFTDEHSKITSRKLHHSDEGVQHEHRRNLSDRQSRNVHLRRSHYKDETVQQHRENFLDRQSRNVHLRRSHYKDETV